MEFSVFKDLWIIRSSLPASGGAEGDQGWIMTYREFIHRLEIVSRMYMNDIYVTEMWGSTTNLLVSLQSKSTSEASPLG
ncbi:MAG: hypothetical protein A2Z47_07335 [Thermodesulfovibrio sp. RBG_19FT_COMBO_42_12]|nr:MAG: hypothetical protein A2Z47_07335 [Thermodesulfovibrio sp. RBG_19FT_COMBO_42_12]